MTKFVQGSGGEMAVGVQPCGAEDGGLVHLSSRPSPPERHDWWNPRENGYPNLGPWESCRKCGIIKNDKNVDRENCRGIVHIGLR